MDFEALVKFLGENWATILATGIILTPVLWVILHFLFRHRLDTLKEQIDSLREQLAQLKEQNEALRQQLAQSPQSGIAKDRKLSAQHYHPLVHIEEGDQRAGREQTTVQHSPPTFRLGGNGFEGGDDAALSLVIDALNCFDTGVPKPYILELPELDDNIQRIRALKNLPQRNEQESRELLQRINSDQMNREFLTVLETCFNIILTNKIFRESGKLHSPTDIWEVLTGLRIQLWPQLALADREQLRLTTTTTDRIQGFVIMTKAEYESENSRYINDNYQKRGFRRGETYELPLFTPTFVRSRCYAAITICLAKALKQGIPTNIVDSAMDLSTWYISKDQ